MSEFIVAEKDDGKRLDVLLAQMFSGHSRSYYQKLIQEEYVFVNGEKSNKKYKTLQGDRVEIREPQKKKIDIVAEDIPIEIVYEDEDILIVDKKAGMVVHPAPGNYEGTLVNAIMYHCGDRLSSINGEIRPGIVHRIDKDTSGLLMIAKNDTAHNSLSTQLRAHDINRGYQAIVYNNFMEDEGTINAPVGRDRNDRKKRAVTDENSKEAITHWKVKERLGKFTLIECRLETGRTHQIRVHMAHIKHPLLGDGVYGPENNKYGANRQMLHAYLLGFKHPKTGKYMEFESKLPEDFQGVLDKLKKVK